MTAAVIWPLLGMAVPVGKLIYDIHRAKARVAAIVGAEEDRLLAQYDRARDGERKAFYALEDSYTKLCVDAHKASNRAQEAQAKFTEISAKKGAKPSEIIRAGNLATETMVAAAHLCNRVLDLEYEVDEARFLHDLNTC